MSSPLIINLPPFLRYSGDVNPLPHGGRWMDVRNWKGDRPDADVLEVNEASDKPYGLLVARIEHGNVGTTLERIKQALVSCGFSDERAEYPDTEIDAVLGYHGMDVGEAYRIAWYDIEPDDLHASDRAKCEAYLNKYVQAPYRFKDKAAATDFIANILKNWK